MTSLASVKGPSITLTLPPESRTRAPCAVGPSPPPPIIVPAFVASLASASMASINSFGGGPCFSACLTNIMYRIFPLLFYEVVSRALEQSVCSGLYLYVERRNGNRQAKMFFSRVVKPFLCQPVRGDLPLASSAQVSVRVRSLPLRIPAEPQSPIRLREVTGSALAIPTLLPLI